MRRSLSIIATAISICLAVASASASDWGTDAKSAQAQSKSEDKLLLMNFTGSDWCHWCKKLEGEIFTEQAFKDYADKNLVLLKLDFPMRTPQSAAVKAQNEALQQKYQIQGFPTVLVLNGNGETIGSLGYVRGGAAAFISQIEALKKS